MSQSVRKINDFFRTAVRKDVEGIKDDLLLSDRQEEIFHMYYIRRLDLNFIADSMGVCPLVISNELKAIRKKLVKVLDFS